MATIGTFKKSGNEFVGQIVTLSVQAKKVRIVPEANRSGENAPSHRVFAGRVEIGAAWAKRSNEGRDYLHEGPEILAKAAETCTPLKSALEVWKNVTFNYESTDMPDYVPTPSVAI